MNGIIEFLYMIIACVSCSCCYEDDFSQDKYEKLTK